MKQKPTRKAVGLRSDEMYVMSVDEQFPIDSYYGTALTPDELSLINQKLDVQNNLHIIDEYANDNASDSYADLYRDQKGFIYVGFTKNAENHIANLKSLFKYPGLLRSFSAQYTKSQLDETTQAIGRDISSLRGQGIIIHLVEPNLPLNRVDVKVASADPDTISFLKNKYGPQVDVASGGIAPADRSTDPPPWKGGIEIYDLNWTCSSAFVGKSLYTNFLGETLWNYYLFTAGHCFPQGDSIYHFIYSVGSVTGRSWPEGGTTNSDAEVISINSPFKSNQVYATDTPTYTNITSAQTVDTDHVGDWVCQSGKTTGFQCGSIQSIGGQGSYSGVTVTDFRIVSFDSCPGDSGGSIFDGQTAVGIVAARTWSGGSEPPACGQARGIYTHIGHAVENLGVIVNTQ